MSTEANTHTVASPPDYYVNIISHGVSYRIAGAYSTEKVKSLLGRICASIYAWSITEKPIYEEEETCCLTDWLYDILESLSEAVEAFSMRALPKD